MAQQEGPFSEYLQQIKMTPPIEVPKPTGMEGTGSAIGNIALNFISGLRQGRQQQYMQQEMEEQKKFDAYQKAMERVSASKLPDAEKKSLYAELEKPLIQRIASDPNATSKKTGNPLTDFFKSVASSVAGPMPKKRTNLEMDPVLKAYQAISDPDRSVDRIGAEYDAAMNKAIQALERRAKDSYEPVDVSDIYNDPGVQQILAQGRARLGKDFAPSSLDFALRKYPKPLSGQDREAERIFLRMNKSTPVTPETPATPVTPEVIPAPPAEGPKQSSPNVAVPPIGAVLLTPAMKKKASDMALVLNNSKFYSVSPTTTRIETPDGNEVNGYTVSVRLEDGSILRGVEDSSTGYVYTKFDNLGDKGFSRKDISNLGTSARDSVSTLLKDYPRETLAFNSQISTDIAAKNGDALRKIPERVGEYLFGVYKSEKAEAAAEKRRIASDASAIASFNRNEISKDKNRVLSQANVWAASQNKKDYDILDAQYKAFSSEVGGINVDAYIADPVKYQKDRNLNRSQMISIETMIDKSLSRLVSKATDSRTGVKQQEEASYTQLVGLPEKVKNQIKYLTGGGSGLLGDYDTRKMLWNNITALRNAVKNKASEDGARREEILGNLGISQELIGNAFKLDRTPTGGLSAIPGAKKRNQ